MRKQEIEFRVLNIIERVVKQQPIEDDTVELKAEWPHDHYRAARRIAGHANAARGEPILWLIGVDEKTGVTGVDFEELSTWFARVQSRFDAGMAPALQSLAVPFDGKTVVALLFETDRAPFVVKNPDGTGPISREVPWREANSTRTAKRADLIKMLYPILRAPRLEILEGQIVLYKPLSGFGEKGAFQFQIDLMMYITTNSHDSVVFPFHRTKLVFRPKGGDESNFGLIRISPPTTFQARVLRETTKSLTVRSSDHEVLVDTAGMVNLTGELEMTDFPPGPLYREILVKGRLSPHHTDFPLVFDVDFTLTESAAKKEDSNRMLARWTTSGKRLNPGDFPVI